MPATSYLACLWPGLPELWYRGRPSALPAALAFAFALNLLLIARFLYPEWLTPLLVRIACWFAFAAWVYSVVRAAKQLPALLDPRAGSDAVDRFPEARRQYLQGHWREAEALLSECLQIESRDPPSMLLLAGVYRHTGRLAAAGRLLDQLERLEVAAAWWLECEAERARLTRYQNVEAEKSETASPDAESMPAKQETAHTSAAPDAPPATVGIGAAAADECLAAELTEASPAPPSA